MRFHIVALVVGEALLTAGLWLAWVPLALVVLGGQLVAFGLLRETGTKR